MSFDVSQNDWHFSTNLGIFCTSPSSRFSVSLNLKLNNIFLLLRILLYIYIYYKYINIIKNIKICNIITCLNISLELSAV